MLTITLNDNLKPTKLTTSSYDDLRSKEHAKVDKFSDWICEIEHNDELVGGQTANGLMNAFLTAYNTHNTLILRPDDIHIALQFIFTTIVNNNSEKMRYLFVEHEGKKELISETSDIDFQFFANDFREQMKQNIKDPEFIDILEAKYTTTTPLISTVSNMLTMDTLKAYFSFTCICSCGIPAIEMHGTIDDWQSLYDKYHSSKTYFEAIDNIIDTWYSKMDNLIDMLLYMRKSNDSGTIEASDYIKNIWCYIISTTYVGSGSDVAYGGIVSLLFPFTSRNKMYDFKDFPLFFTNKDAEEKKNIKHPLKFGSHRSLSEFKSSLTDTDAKMIVLDNTFPIKIRAGVSTFVHYNEECNTISASYIYKIQKKNDEREKIMEQYKLAGYYIVNSTFGQTLMAPMSDTYNWNANYMEIFALFDVTSMNYYEDPNFDEFKKNEIQRLKEKGIYYNEAEKKLYVPESEETLFKKSTSSYKLIFGRTVFRPKYY